MIDVSSLTHLQAAIALLIERSGSKGRRICELENEVNATRRAIELAVAHLIGANLVSKFNGDAPRYFPPNVDSYTHSRFSSKPRNVNVYELTEQTNKEFSNSEEEPCESRVPVFGLLGVKAGMETADGRRQTEADSSDSCRLTPLLPPPILYPPKHRLSLPTTK